jgi:hypothetical protein
MNPWPSSSCWPKWPRPGGTGVPRVPPVPPVSIALAKIGLFWRLFQRAFWINGNSAMEYSLAGNP